MSCIAKDIAEELQSKYFLSTGEFLEFLESKINYIKTVGKSLGDESADGYKTISEKKEG